MTNIRQLVLIDGKIVRVTTPEQAARLERALKFMDEPLRMKRVKVDPSEPQQYQFVDSAGTVQADAVKTGDHLDNFPWAWGIEFDHSGPRDRGRQESTLDACKREIAKRWKHRVR